VRKTQFRSGRTSSASGVVTPGLAFGRRPDERRVHRRRRTLTIYNPTSGNRTVVTLPAANWTVSGSILKEKDAIARRTAA
jgi:hypothetical protein